MRSWGLLVILITATAAATRPPSGVWISAHRGAKTVAPENTIAAYEAAAKAGANYIEVDVRRTRDGKLVIMHDSTVDRTTNGHGAVADLTSEKIGTLDAGQGQHVPTFREALLWAKKRGVNIDVDHKAGDVEELAAVIKETGMTSNVVIEGKREQLARFVTLLPGVDTMPKVTSAADASEVCRSLHTTIIRLSLAQLESRELVSAVHACGARVSITILGQTDTQEQMRRAVEAGAQIIETDHPDVLNQLRRTRIPSVPEASQVDNQAVAR